MAREHLVGLVRVMRRSTVEAQTAELEAHGCTRIWAWEDRSKLLRYVGRKGDRVAMTQAHCLGPSRQEAASLFGRLMDRGVVVEVLRPPLTSMTPREAALIAFSACAGLAGDSKALTTDDARMYGKRTGQKKRAKRSSFEAMRRAWTKGKSDGLSVSERMALPEMRDWSKSGIYRAFSERGLKP